MGVTQCVLTPRMFVPEHSWEILPLVYQFSWVCLNFVPPVNLDQWFLSVFTNPSLIALSLSLVVYNVLVRYNLLSCLQFFWWFICLQSSCFFSVSGRCFNEAGCQIHFRCLPCSEYNLLGCLQSSFLFTVFWLQSSSCLQSSGCLQLSCLFTISLALYNLRYFFSQ